MAHLVNFDQTDTAAGPLAAKKYYNAVAPGFSVVNMEHSAVSAWTRSREGEMFRGRPDWSKLLDFRYTQLTKEEQRFLDHECEELCAMTDDAR